jgi:hypothetical protein
VRTYYELLGVQPDADADAIKKAFRREIARYHPDKVTHLGPEFQEIAATRSAELTAAYKTLTDAEARASYDASLREGPPPPPPPPPAAPDEPAEPAERAARGGPPPAAEPAAPAGDPRRFARERAGRDVILGRAVTLRTREVVERLYGTVNTPAVRGFDLALVPTAKRPLLGASPPRVLIKVVERADARAVQQACAHAARARVHVGKSPVIAVLLAHQIAPWAELQPAFDAVAHQPVPPGGPAEVSVMVVDLADMAVRMPLGCSEAVRKLAQALRS